MESNPIDVVITVLPDSNRAWLAKCLYSLKGEPVNIYFVNGIYGCIGYGRAESLSLGGAKYLAFIDHDDEVVPGIFSKIIPMLEDEPVHIYTDEVLIDANGRALRQGWSQDQGTLKGVPEDILPLLWDGQNHCYMHHLNIFQREAAKDFTAQLYMGHRAIEGHLFQHINKKGVVKHLPEVGYRWRIHTNNGIWSF